MQHSAAAGQPAVPLGAAAHAGIANLATAKFSCAVRYRHAER
jgi:hypothetical protein